jgi:sugar lactone lactonase YvrE
VTGGIAELGQPFQSLAVWQQRQVNTVATFIEPQNIASDGLSLYVSDTGNNRIRKIEMATSQVSTLAGSANSGSVDGIGQLASFNKPQGIVVLGQNLYVLDTNNHKIRKIVIATGVVSTLAGSGKAGTADGVGIGAEFNYSKGIVTDGQNVYVADPATSGFDHIVIRKVDINSGKVSTMYKFPFKSGADGHGRPLGLASNGTDVYISESGQVSKINILTGAVLETRGISTPWPQAIAVDDGYIFTLYNSVRKIEFSTGKETLVAGNDKWGAADGFGSTARFKLPTGLIVVGRNLFVVDSFNHMIRKVGIDSGLVTTVAGQFVSGATDGAGAAFYPPSSGISSDGSSLYVADYYNHTIHKIDLATGIVNTLAGSGVAGDIDGIGTAAEFGHPDGLTYESGNLYLADYSNHTIRKIELATSKVSTLAGSSKQGNADGIGAEASFNYPRSLVSDGSHLYVSDYANHSIRQIEIATGKVTTLAGSGKIGSKNGTGADASFNYPRGVSINSGNLYIADTFNHKIRKIEIASGKVTTLAGNGQEGAVDNIGTAATFSYPQNLVVSDGNLYVSDQGNHAIRKIVIATGVVSTLAGSGKVGAKDGTGIEAAFNQPEGIATDGKNLYVIDSGYRTIRKIEIASGAVSTLVATQSLTVPGSLPLVH